MQTLTRTNAAQTSVARNFQVKMGATSMPIYDQLKAQGLRFSDSRDGFVAQGMLTAIRKLTSGQILDRDGVQLAEQRLLMWIEARVEAIAIPRDRGTVGCGALGFDAM